VRLNHLAQLRLEFNKCAEASRCGTTLLAHQHRTGYRSEAMGAQRAGCSKRLSSKAAASEEARRYEPHFVWPFALRINLGERKSPTSVSDLRKVPFTIELLSDARTPLADFFSILLDRKCVVLLKDL